MTEKTPHVIIESINADYTPDGTLRDTRSIEIRANYSETAEHRFNPDDIDRQDEIDELAEKYEPGEIIDTEYLNGAYARYRFDVDIEGTASVTEFKDASPNDSNWVSFEFLRTVWAVEQVAANVPGVERVEPVLETIKYHIRDGEGAEIDR